MAIGFRIFPSPKRADPALLERLRALPVSNVSDNMQRCHGTNLEPIHRSGKMVGTAFTVKTRPGDNLMVHKAIDMAAPGDVIVVDAGGALEQALSEWDFPVYAAGVTHRGPYKDGPGEINVVVSVGGMVVRPGDLVAGDHDGVVAISQEDAERVITAAEAQHKKEQASLAAIGAGTWDRRWVDEALEARGCNPAG